MTTRDATTMPASDLNPFLFAGVGTQANGVELTVLSLLARLGSDPWAEAERLALLPRGAATDWLAARIAPMPPGAQARGAARDTAAALLLLLPTRTTIDRALAGAEDRGGRTAMWVFAAMVIAGLGLAAITLHAPSSAPTDRTIQGER